MQLAVKLVLAPSEFFTNIINIALAYFEKYTYDVGSYFVHVVPKAVAGWCSIKKVFIKFTRMPGIYLVSPNKNHKILENTLYCRGAFKTQSNIYDGTFCENS